MKAQQKVMCLVLEDFLWQKVESFRQSRMAKTGYISRSGAVRILVDRALAAFSEDGDEKKDSAA